MMKLTKLLTNNQVENLEIQGLPLLFHPDAESQKLINVSGNDEVVMDALKDGSPRRYAHILHDMSGGSKVALFFDVRMLSNHFNVALPPILSESPRDSIKFKNDLSKALLGFLKECCFADGGSRISENWNLHP